MSGEARSEVVYSGRDITVRREVFFRGGRVIDVELLDHPGAVAVLARTEGGTFVLEEQYRPAMGGRIYEFPAGTLRKGEEPSSCARRELLEETGYLAETLRPLGSIVTAPGYSTETIHLFFAEAKKQGTPSLEEDEEISVLEAGPLEILNLVREGRLRDSKSLSLLLVAGLSGLLPPEATPPSK
ncbi:MAG: NUDIX hydrolase [Nitrososphaerota archaeon]|nr:NUDIX hydrolase [Nitrososphaerota archaeon]